MTKYLRMFWLVLCCSILIASWAAAESVAVNPSKVSLPKKSAVMRNRTVVLTPTLSPSDATTTFRWYSSKKSVATVLNGVVTGVKPGKTTITIKTANNKKATCTVTVTEVSMTNFSVSLSDWQGEDCYYEDEDEGEAFFWEVTGHKMYPSISDVEPVDANRTIVWKSLNPKVATVSSKGVVTCEKSGSTFITATSKYGGYKVTLPVTVISNSTSWSVDDCFDDLDEYDDGYYYTSAKRVYAKSGYLYVDMYILNMDSFTIRRLSKQRMYMTFSYSDDEPEYYYVGSYKATLKKNIPPYSVGVATFKLAKINAGKAWLIDADAYCEGYSYSKAMGADLKAVVPNTSAASKRAQKKANGTPRYTRSMPRITF